MTYVPKKVISLRVGCDFRALKARLWKYKLPMSTVMEEFFMLLCAGDPGAIRILDDLALKKMVETDYDRPKKSDVHWEDNDLIYDLLEVELGKKDGSCDE